MPKNRIREKHLKQRRELNAETYRAMSLAVQRRVLQLDVFQAAERIALYAPIRGEVDTDLLFERSIQLGKCISFPRVDGASMSFVVTPDKQGFSRGRFGVMEPLGSQLLDVEQLQLVVVPGVAFGRCGSRLGYGKGFYDQTFEVRPASCVLIGLGFSFQLEENLPKEAHDVGLDAIVTELELLEF